MFLIRTAFWLLIIILLLPTDSRQQDDVYGTAQAAVKDVTGFCERNPDACVKGMNIFNMLMQKAQFGAHVLVGFIQDKSGSGTEQTESVAAQPEVTDASAPAGADPISWDPSTSGEASTQNTLNPEDLQVEWGGPRQSGA